MVTPMPNRSATKSPGFPEILQSWMALEGIKADEAGKRMKVSGTIVRDWLGGACAPNRNHWSKVAKALGCTIEDVAVAIAQGVK